MGEHMRHMDKRGKFIVIDGPDGAGKSTVIKTVAENLKENGFSVVLTREPGGSPYAEKIREVILSDDAKDADPHTMLYLFNASRIEHIAKTVRPGVERGDIVISDRFDSTSYAYQIVAEQRRGLKPLYETLRAQYKDMWPYYILLDISPDAGRSRLQDRGKMNHFDKRDPEWHAQARQGFLEFANEVCGPENSAVVSAEQPREALFRDVWNIVSKKVGL